MAVEQGEHTSGSRRGRPRKWPSEAARREHEAAKRRLRNKTHLASETLNDVVRLTTLADDLQHRLDGANKELEELRERGRELERRLAEVAQAARPNQGLMAPTPVPNPLQVMNRQQRREAERVQRQAEVQQRRSAPPV